MTDDGEGPKPAVEVPHTEIAAETLRRLIESFVLREGTEYGSRDFSLDEKVTHVIAQLKAREAKIYFDPNTETIDIRRAGAR